MKKHILIVDDDAPIGDLLQEALEKKGCRVTRAWSGTEALLCAERERPDLVLLDLMLPGLSGEEALRHFAGVPVIIMSAKADPDHKAELLLGGAVDYVTKPFSLKELLARVALRLRNGADTGAALTFDGLTLDLATHALTVAGRPVHITRTEFAILKLLMRDPAAVVTKSEILERIAEDTPDCTETSLKMHVSNLRRKLRAADGADHIEAVWGIGFKLRESVQGVECEG